VARVASTANVISLQLSDFISNIVIDDDILSLIAKCREKIQREKAEENYVL